MLMPFNLVSLKSRKLVWLSSDLWRGVKWVQNPAPCKLRARRPVCSRVAGCALDPKSTGCCSEYASVRWWSFTRNLFPPSSFCGDVTSWQIMRSCNVALGFPPDVVVWMTHTCWWAPVQLAGVWKENASPQKSPSRNHEPKHDHVQLASQLHHKQTGMEHSETSGKRRRYLGQERHSRQRLEQLRFCSLGWVTELCGRSKDIDPSAPTQLCSNTPNFNYPIAHARCLVSTK